MPIATVAADKLGGHMGGVHGAAAVAEQQQLVASAEHVDQHRRDLLDQFRMLSCELYLRLGTVLKPTLDLLLHGSSGG